MSAHSRDLDALLDALVAALPAADHGEQATQPGPIWLALAATSSGAQVQRSASWRFAARWGVPGVVVCRDQAQASAVSAARGGDTVLHSTASLASVLQEGELPAVQLLFLEAADPGKDDLRLKGSPAPALVIASLPQAPWRRRWAAGRLRRRLARQGYDCLAMTGQEGLFRHRRLRTAPAARTTASSSAPPPTLRIHSFDFWDTLITRWHPDPKVVFDYVGDQAGIPGFRALRVQAEREARGRHGNYSLDHIYEALVGCGSIPEHRREGIQQLELDAEQEFAQPVRANLDRLRAGDVLISDMYLSADQMRHIARPHTDLDRQPFVVSAGGKSSSSLWKQLKKAGISARHLGDNYAADYVKAARRDHQASLVRESSYSPLERRFHGEGLVALANLLRLQRLAVPLDHQRLGQPATGLDGLLTVQRRFNLPLLYLVALELLQRGRQSDGPSHLLFCSRDCGYLHGIYRAMTRACDRFETSGKDSCGPSRRPLDHYYLTSRKAKRKASAAYRAYSRSLLSGNQEGEEPDPLVVDVQGSGRSSFEFFGSHLNLPIRQLFVYAGEGSLASYRAETLLQSPFVRRLLPRACDLLEVLNYSSDHSLLDMHQLGETGFIPEFEPEQRPERLLAICRSVEGFFHRVKQLMGQGPFQYLFVNYDLKTFNSDHLKLLEEIDGLEDLQLLRELYLRFHRRH
ncbi:MAG: hypothetical protein R6U00_00675 [Prochlorococcaceae cyanobacterium]